MQKAVEVAFVFLLLMQPAQFMLAKPYYQSNRNEDGKKPATEELVPLKAQTTIFKIVEGENEGDLMSIQFTESDPASGRWKFIFGDSYTFLIRRESDKALKIDQVLMHKRGKRVYFEPALILVPAVAQAGARIPLSGMAKVVDSQTGNPIITGNYDFTLKEVSHAAFNTPIGSINGFLLEYDIWFDFVMINVHINLKSGWSRDHALVYWHNEETVEIPWFFDSTSVRVMTLELAARTSP